MSESIPAFTLYGMEQELRIIELERELIATRSAAVTMIVGMAQGIARTPEGLAELADGFDEAAKEADPVTARLARLAALALRR